jgi:HD superfamily phosphohydrolase YqeK
MDDFDRFRTAISWTGNIATDVHAFLVAHESAPTAIHCGSVAAEARRVALLYGVEPSQAESALLAREVFGVHDAGVLSAIGCHTTLKRDASMLDKVVFVADKLAWDQPGTAPFHDAMHAALRISLDHAAGAYMTFLWERRTTLRVVHPSLRDAYEQWVEQGGLASAS